MCINILYIFSWDLFSKSKTWVETRTWGRWGEGLGIASYTVKKCKCLRIRPQREVFRQKRENRSMRRRRNSFNNDSYKMKQNGKWQIKVSSADPISCAISETKVSDQCFTLWQYQRLRFIISSVPIFFPQLIIVQCVCVCVFVCVCVCELSICREDSSIETVTSWWNEKKENNAEGRTWV